MVPAAAISGGCGGGTCGSGGWPGRPIARALRAIGGRPDLGARAPPLVRVAGEPLVELAARQARRARRDLRGATRAEAGVAQLHERLVQVGLGGPSAGRGVPAASTMVTSPGGGSVKRAATSAAVPRTTSSWSFVSSRQTTMRRSGSRAASVASVRGQAAGSLERDQRYAPAVGRVEPGVEATGGARQEADEREAVAIDAGCGERRGDGGRAGITSTTTPAAAAACTSRVPGSETAGMPASVTSAMSSPWTRRSTRRAAPCSSVLASRRSSLGAGMPRAVSSARVAPRVLARDHGRIGEGLPQSRA